MHWSSLLEVTDPYSDRSPTLKSTALMADMYDFTIDDDLLLSIKSEKMWLRSISLPQTHDKSIMISKSCA